MNTSAKERNMEPERVLNLNLCRLCDGPSSYRFNKKILAKYNVGYFECVDCGSLQTEPPHWLDEAYGNSKISNLDTGAAQRNMRNLAACLAIAKLHNLKNILDIGGGDGLLCRLLRDYGLNCYVKDKYSEPKYGKGFTDQDFVNPDLVLGFEILEHLPNPKLDLDEFFKYQPKLLLFTTDIWRYQSSDWWYLTPESGQHVFFYSKKALDLIATKYEYSLLVCSGYIVFTKKSLPNKDLFLRFFLKDKIIRLIKGLVAVLPARGVWKDYLIQKEKNTR